MNVLNSYLDFPWHLDVSLHCLDEDFIILFYVNFGETCLNCSSYSLSHCYCFNHQDWCYSQVECCCLNKTYPFTAWWDDLEPSKLILMNPSWGFLYAIQLVFLGLEVGVWGYGGWIDCVSLCLIRHSTLAFFALVKGTPELDVSSRSNFLLRIFHVLQRSATTLSSLIRGLTPLSWITDFGH